MTLVLVATHSGFRAFTDTGEGQKELAGRPVGAVALETGGTCLAVVDGQEIWRRDASGKWSEVAKTNIGLQSLAAVNGIIFGGAMDEAAILRITPTGPVERLNGFDKIAGRREWFAGGPPLGVRALTGTANGDTVLAAVHVGGIPRSSDRGETWTPTIPITFDVHEVRAHPSRSNVIAAATAVGLCVSHDSGQNWKVLSAGLEIKNSLAVAVLQDEVLFGLSDGPFAKRSQVWRWRIGGEELEQVGDGLPPWLDGKIDTAWIAAGAGRTAIFDGGGNLWFSRAGSTGWKRIAVGLPPAFGVLVL